LAAWTQWLGEELLALVPHRQMVFTVPKRAALLPVAAQAAGRSTPGGGPHGDSRGEAGRR
jgi:hypothetical protein